MRSSWLWALSVGGAAPAAAQYLVSELSFGYGSRISAEHNNLIPNFSVQGHPQIPEILSNKIILTPPAPGNIRAGVWSDRDLDRDTWTVDVDFRVNGPERGGGNLNIWLARDGAHDVGSASIYTAGKFEGLALVIDSPSGAGMIRGFLNDGTTDYKSNTIGGLSFGHCNYYYRNMGRSSQLKVRQLHNNFRVEIDGNLCFESSKIRVPSGYRLGITGASADNPDSFEVFKMVVMTENVDSHHGQDQKQSQQQQSQTGTGQTRSVPTEKKPRDDWFGRDGMPADYKTEEWEKDVPDANAGDISNSKAQFEDLHVRLQSIQHHTAAIFRQVAKSDVHNEKRQEELAIQLDEFKGMVSKVHRIADLEGKIDRLENEIRQMKRELFLKITDSEQGVRGMVGSHHEMLQNSVKLHAGTGHWRLVTFIIGAQVLTVAGYVYYKRRKSMPKKYL